MQINGQIPLKYSSDQYKYQKMILVSESETCAISQMTIKELAEANISRGLPHILALVHGEKSGQDIYDAVGLGDNLCRNKRLEWINPVTNEKIKRIDYFAINRLSEGYHLLKKIKLQSATAQVYEDLWFCNNLAFAADSQAHHSYQSAAAMVRHYKSPKDEKENARWHYNCYKSIEYHFGQGMAYIYLYPILSGKSLLFSEFFLIQGLSYTILTDFFKESELEAWIVKSGEDLFRSQEREKNIDIYKGLFCKVLQERKNHLAAKCASFFFEAFMTAKFQFNDLVLLTSSTNQEIADLAKVALCVVGGDFQDKYLDELLARHPSLKIAQALKINSGIKRSSTKEAKLALCNDLINLSRDTRDPKILKMLADWFNQWNLSSSIWLSAENILMKILFISRFEDTTSRAFVKSIKKDTAHDHILALTENNLNYFDDFDQLDDLSVYQRELGLSRKDKPLYSLGIKNGLRLHEARERHTILLFDLGSDLVAEITAFKSTPEDEAKGVEISRKEFEKSPNHPNVKLALGEYLIRKGTRLQAKEAQQWMESLMPQFKADVNLRLNFIRAQLRFAEHKDELLRIETSIADCEKLGNSSALFMIKALWHSHPLNRSSSLEWFITASHHFKKAFENADTIHVQFLLDHLSRYDKLTEEDQIKCRTMILELLGQG